MEESRRSLLEDSRNIRQSNFELLRIAAMVMIVFHHFAVHGGFAFESTTLSIPRFWFNFIVMGGKTGVNLFVLISGYFLIQSTTTGVNLSKVLKLWGQVFFYSVVIYAASAICTGSISLRQLVWYCMPITREVWWFASTYFVLYLVHPYLNLLLRAMDKKTYQRFLFLILFSWCIIPTFLTSAFESNYLLWFMTLYSLAGYLRLFGWNKSLSGRFGMLAAVFAVLTYVSSVVFTILGTRWPVFSAYNTYFYGMNRLPVLLTSVCLFLVFANWKVEYNKWINRISSAAFGVYLIHDSAIIRPLLWETVFHNADYQDSVRLIPYSIAVVIVVYGFCTAFDLLRQMTVERAWLGLVHRNVKKLFSLAKRTGDFLRRILFGD